ncbi:MAG: DUF4258 domain-containing protein [Deltaproteobacteria bacterium]|nr:DUF4258 domain-containing protein [Deltaproteobacteria bacterium]
MAKGSDIIITKHAGEMIKERGIPEEWVWRAIGGHEHVAEGVDDNSHYYKRIPEYGSRVPHVVVNRRALPHKVVTVFFDRKAGRQI